MTFEEYREKLSQGCVQPVPLGRPNPSRSSLPSSQTPRSPVQSKKIHTAVTESTRPPWSPHPNMSIGPPLTTQRSDDPVPREAPSNSGSSLTTQRSSHPVPREAPSDSGPPSTMQHSSDPVPHEASSNSGLSVPRPSPPRITSKGWSVPELCRKYEKFQPVRRISALSPPDVIAKALEEYEQDGLPLIISDWHKHPKWPQDIFNLEWLIQTSGDTEIHVRNLHNRQDQSMSLSEFVKKSQSQSRYTVPGETERLYWKDADCPLEWKDWLLRSGAIPTSVLPASPDDYLGYLFPSEAVESLLCYMGIGDTYTASHKDLCASSGHNLMCFSEENASSFWFMTASNDAPRVAEYFQKKLKQELDWETHVTTVDELGNAPTTVYVAEQKVGDLVLVPPRSCHQVVNCGGLAMKTSWSRMTLDSLEKALHCELPVYRRVCRPEQYRVKTILYRSMLHLTKVLQQELGESQANDRRERTSLSVDEDIVDGLCNNSALTELASYNSPSPELGTPEPSPSESVGKLAECGRKLRRLVQLFDEVLHEEYSSTHAEMKHMVSYESSAGWMVADGSAPDDNAAGPSSSSGGRLILRPPADQRERQEERYDRSRNESFTLACDFCGADIFQSFFECNRCREPEPGVEAQIGDGLLICPGCYVEGRSCLCDMLEPVQCRPFDTLVLDRNSAAKAISSVLPHEEHVETLEKSSILGKDDSYVFEAACALYLLRMQRLEKPGRCSRSCRAKNPDNHKSFVDEGLNCGICHSFSCFGHLLSKGTHAVQAILRHGASENKHELYHDTHRANERHAKRMKIHVELDELSNVHERMLVAAVSFPKCRPGHAKVKLGWYDRESRLQVIAEQAPATPAKEVVSSEARAPEQLLEPTSPLTPVESDIESLFDGPSAEERQLNGPGSKQPESAVTVPSADEDLVIELTTSDSESPSPVMGSAVCYVKPPPLPPYASGLKRAASTSGLSIASRKKPRAADADDPDELSHSLNAAGRTRRPRPSHVIPDAASDGEDSPVEDASNAVAMDLVRALSQANQDAPIYTNRSRHGRVRVIESDIEEIQVSPPHIDESNPPREETRISSTSRPAPVASGSSSSRPVRSDLYSIAKPPLPRTSTLKRPRAEETLGTREHGPQPRHSGDLSGPAQDSSLTASDRLPKKRKGPPGIPRDVMDRQLSERKQKFEQKRKSEQRRKRREQSSRRGPEQRTESYAIGNHNTVRRSSARDIEAPARRVSRLDPPPTLPSGKAIVRASTSAGNQGFDEQDSVMVTSGPIDEVSRQGLSQAVVAISGASDPTHVPTVSIRASLSAPTSTATSLFGQPQPPLAPPMHTGSYREADHPSPSRSTTIQRLLEIQNNDDVSLGTLVNSIRHLASAGLETEQQRQDFENSLQALTVEVRTLAEAKRNLEEELGSVQGQLGSIKDELSNVSNRLQKEREERGRQAGVIRDLQEKFDTVESGLSERVRELVAPMIAARLQQTKFAHPAPPTPPGPAAVCMPGPSHEYPYPGQGHGPWPNNNNHNHHNNNMGQQCGPPPASFNAWNDCSPQNAYVPPPGQFNGRGQDGHFRGRTFDQGRGRHHSNGYGPPRGPPSGGDNWDSRPWNNQSSPGPISPRQNNHASAPQRQGQGGGNGGYRGQHQRRGSDDTRGRQSYNEQHRRRSMSRGGNDHRGFSRPPDAPRSESSEHTHRRNTPPSTMESPSERPQPTRGGSPSGNLPEPDVTSPLEFTDFGDRAFNSPRRGPE